MVVGAGDAHRGAGAAVVVSGKHLELAAAYVWQAGRAPDARRVQERTQEGI